MFHKLRKKMKRQIAHRHERTEVVRGQLERLEERAMLSISPGSMAYGHPGPDFGPHYATSSHYGDSIAVASQPQRPVSYDTQMFSAGREVGGSYHELQSQPPMSLGYPSPWRPQTFEQHGIEKLVSSQPPANFQSSTYGLAYSDEPDVIYVMSVQTVSVWRPPFVNVLPTFQQTQKNEPTTAGGYPPKSLAAKLPPPDPALGSFDFESSIERLLGGHTPTPGQGSLDPSKYSLPYGIQSLVTGSASNDLSTISQILSRESGTVATLTALARDVAFQDFSSTLFQANGTPASQRTTPDGVALEGTQADALDGFIRPTDESIASDIANSSDAVAREREAVDAVLEELHDLSTLRPASASVDGSLQLDLQTETAFDEMPASEVDGGMVLLHSAVNVNESAFDLAPVYAEHLERFDAPAKMEMSVGMIQAVDVATDDAPLIETVPSTDTTIQLKPEMKLDDKLPTKREQTSSNKAAAIVGATTLTGALVWLNRPGGRLGQPKSTAQKRRASRG
jgi:hypothetical protein